MRGLRYDSPACVCRIGLRDVRRRRSLEQVAARPAANRAEHVLVRIVGGEHHDAAALAREAGDAIELVGVRQLQVEKDDVRTKRRGQSQAFARRLGRADHLDVPLALEHRHHPFAHDGVILDDEHLNHSAPAVR